MADIIGQLVFLSIFHAVGGAALGITLRGWVNDPSHKEVGRLFFLVWGGMFGCMPLLFGLEYGLPMLAAQVAVLLSAIAVPFFWLDRLRELFSNQNLVLTGVGGIFLVAGLAAGGFLLREGQWLPAALFGVPFVSMGGGIFFYGLRSLLQGSAED